MASSSLLVAAIDFGTTYSGWAFSFKHEFDRDPTKVSAKNWTGGQLVSLKGPTCVLIESDGQTLHSFGYEAENKYADLVVEGDHKSWYFFKRFKMMLFDAQGLRANALLEDASGKKLSAKTVFSLSIKHLKEDLIKLSESRIAGGGLQNGDIHWVLTVPAIWNDAAKQFMRQAAEAAGILGTKLTIALEPEAASLYCRHLPVEKCGSGQTSLAKFGAGKRYLVLDAGGGTVDITVHEVMTGGRLKELHKASGGAWGGTKVDDAYNAFLCEITGPNVMATFRTKHIEDYIEMFRDFEVKKREMNPSSDRKITIRLPSDLAKLVKEMRNMSLEETIAKSKYPQLKLVGDKLRLDPSVAKAFFEPSVNSIIQHVKTLLREPVNSGVEAIVMVGGFSESQILQAAVKNDCAGVRVIIPDEAGLAVLKGAVIFGHSPETISERVSKFTYGTDVAITFDADKHHFSKLNVDSTGRLLCHDVFSKLVEAGQTLVVGKAQDEQGYSTTSENQTSMGMNIYATQDRNPKYIDDIGCHRVGTFSVPVSGTGIGRAVSVKMIFGGTEIDVECKEIATGKITHLKVDFLS